ncbi:hypothetical protein [Salipiger bermudensis]|uniref:hypothetical protein n=1 Tax=Salipiger bermudensis TaxID=344736 RepID=UPI00300B3365
MSKLKSSTSIALLIALVPAIVQARASPDEGHYFTVPSEVAKERISLRGRLDAARIGIGQTTHGETFAQWQNWNNWMNSWNNWLNWQNW